MFYSGDMPVKAITVGEDASSKRPRGGSSSSGVDKESP